jgi:hypothetical protein
MRPPDRVEAPQPVRSQDACPRIAAIRKHGRKMATAMLGTGFVMTVTSLAPTAILAAPPSPTQPATSQSRPYHYVAQTVATAAKQGAVVASGIQWRCTGARCTTSGPWPNPAVGACKALAVQVGRIRSYGRNGARLNAKQLRECNAVAAVPKMEATSTAGAGTSQAMILGQPQTSGHEQGGSPAGGPPAPGSPQLPAGGGAAIAPGSPGPVGDTGGGATGVPGGPGGVPPRGAAETIAQAAAGLANRPIIDSVEDSSRLGCARREFIVTGRHFGESAGSRRLMLVSPLRLTPIDAPPVVSTWGDTRITASLPDSSYARPGERYVVAIVDGHGNPLSNTSRELRVCPSLFTVEGDIRMTNCSAGPANVRILLYRDGGNFGIAQGQSVPGNDFAIHYSVNLSALMGPSQIELRPELVGITCAGGGWVPDRGVVPLDYEHPHATQAFEYRVGMETRRIPMTLVSRLVQDAFSGTAIRINNYDPETHLVRENDSFVRLSDALGGTERRFNIGPAVSGPRKYYINDINLASTRVMPAGNELRVSMAFESDGMELIGTCGQDGFDAGCVAGAPDVQATIAVDIYFTLDRYYSRAAPVSLSFSRVRVVPNVNAQADGLCLALDFLCSAINDYRTLIRTVVQQSFTTVLDTPGVRDQIARALLPTLRGLRIGTLNSVRVEGSDLVLSYLTDFE